MNGVIRREWQDVNRPDVFTIIPVGDIHLGNAACDEARFKATVERIASDPMAYWIGLGDYCEFINLSDNRFETESLADWLKVHHLGDLARAQKERFLELVEPIAGKCLALVEGNHEAAIRRRYERDIYRELVLGIKEQAGFPVGHRLALGVCGWLLLSFYRADRQTKTRRTMRFYLHHGFVGGKLAGAKALNMQRWLWTHNADCVIFGHSHNTGVQVEAVESCTTGGRIEYAQRLGVYGGTYMRGARYAQEKGYFPLPLAQVEIRVKPGSVKLEDRLHVVTSG